MAKVLRVFLLAASTCAGLAADTNAFLNSWLAAQAQLKTWSADFTQTRTLKTLKQPLTSTGHLVFKAPNNFRWELGNPAQTMAIRSSNEMVVIYPKLKRAEKYPLSGGGNEPWRDALALMDAGFPASRAELESRFKLLSISQTGAVAQIVMEPRSAMAKRFMSEALLTLNTNDFSMAANQLRFADGSVLRNDFTNAVKNPDVPANAFAADFPKDFNVVEPMKQ
jgi:outer membrane lipoprotein-sorting protein